MKFQIENPSKNESHWDGWCYQRLYERELQPDENLLEDALSVLNTLGCTWTGMHRGVNHDVSETDIRKAVEKSLEVVHKSWYEVVQIRLTASSVIVDFDDVFCSFYVKPVRDGKEILLQPL